MGWKVFLEGRQAGRSEPCVAMQVLLPVVYP